MEKITFEPTKFIPQVDLSHFKPYKGSKHVLEMKRLNPRHAMALQRALQVGTSHIVGYFAWAGNASGWSTRDALFWIQQQLRDELPREHFSFFLGPDLVGMGSLVGHEKSRHVQQMYWVSKKFIGQGIGESIALSLENLALIQRPYEGVFIDHDSSNRNSGKIPQSLGYRFIGTYDLDIQAKNETGLWFSYFKKGRRYDDLGNERLKDLRFAILFSEMIMEMHPDLYEETYRDLHLSAIEAFKTESDKEVLAIFQSQTV